MACFIKDVSWIKTETIIYQLTRNVSDTNSCMNCEHFLFTLIAGMSVIYITENFDKTNKRDQVYFAVPTENILRENSVFNWDHITISTSLCSRI